MKRDFNTLYARNEQDGYQIGDDAAHRAAAALADLADAPTIQAMTAMLSFSELIGGQFHVTAVREKVDRYGNRVGNDDDANWSTIGLVFNYETRDIRVVEADPPASFNGIPVTDSQEPGTRIEIERPERADAGDAETPAIEDGGDHPEIQDVEEPVALTD